MYAQETTAALQGTIKDVSGAVISGATVIVTTPSLPGGDTATTDSKGYYHFSNLPPGAYLITVEAKGFSELKREGLVLEVGHDPTVDLTLKVGAESAVVEVSSESPQIDVTSVTTQTNITQDVVNYVPHGTTFQSVIQFAPDASNEPLMGNTGGAWGSGAPGSNQGSGGTSPGNGSNGGSYGYSIGGGSDSENAYLVEGQETANLIGGFSHTTTPFDFIQEVSVKTSGIQAQYGGAMGGVINVIMQKGTAHYHGSVFMQYESTGLDANPSNAFSRYDPSPAGAPIQTSWGYIDQAYQSYQPVKPKSSTIFPGFRLGGPLLPFSKRFRDKIFFFAGFNPEIARYEETLNYGPANVASPGNVSGEVPFSQNTNTYYTNARIDAQVTQKIRVFGSWLYQLQRQNGEALPQPDSKQGFLNTATDCYGSSGATCLGGAAPQFSFAHNLGFVAPNVTVNTGADITISPSLVSTTRFGYYFENYHDFGYSTTGNSYYFETAGTSPGVQQNAGYQNDAFNSAYTTKDASKAIQVDQGFAWFKSTSFGTHNFNFGYQLNRLSNIIDQHYNNPYVEVYADSDYTTATAVGPANCVGQITDPSNPNPNCQGTNGYVAVYDFGTNGNAISYNNGIYGQDSWTIGKGVTLDLGIRDEKEFLPGEAQPGPGVPTHPINFGWKDKIAPRLGASWDVFHDGKLKLFGSYGKFYDVMKLNLAISSFGGQYWQNCMYALNTSYTAVDPVYNSNARDCIGNSAASTATFSGLPAGQSPAGVNFIENVNFRAFPTTCSTCSATEEGVAPNLKPYQQHEAVFGTDYQVSRNVAFEARYDRRRLDRAIEDSSIFNPVVGGETFVVVNPGFGINNTFSSFCNFLYGTGAPNCAQQPIVNSAGVTTGYSNYPPNQTIPAARSYDGLELRLNKAMSNHWSGMISYTYSYFRGNYTGLTSSDLSDGGLGGRNSPNNSRAFDEPFFSWNSMGGSSSGRLPTDRPNKLKGYGYYEFKYLQKLTTDLGMFSYIYQGSPNTSYIQDVGLPAGGDYPVDIFNRGVWADFTQNPGTGAITVGQPRVYRNPVYAQSDFNFTQSYQIAESKSLSFQATFTNVFNEHAVTAVNEQVDSNSNYLNNSQLSSVGGYNLLAGVPFYAAVEHPYNVQNMLNSGGATGGPQTLNSAYGKPLYWQQPREIRLQVHFNF